MLVQFLPRRRSFWAAVARVAVVMWLLRRFETSYHSRKYGRILRHTVNYRIIALRFLTLVLNADSYPLILYGVNLIRRVTGFALDLALVGELVLTP